MRSKPSADELFALADALELEACTDRLIALESLEPPEAMKRTGRYRRLEAAIEQNGDLRAALLRETDAEAARQWARHLEVGGPDIDVYHSLAVAYRERAFRRLAGPGPAEAELEAATALWFLLLASPAFWERQGDVDDESRVRSQLATELLEIHARQGARALAAGEHAVARTHLNCLAACRSGGEAVEGLLQRQSVPYDYAVDRERADEIAAVAAGLLDAWCADVVQTAERITTEPERLTRLPEGLPADYAAGIEHLGPFLSLGVPFKQALRTCLGWYNSWCDFMLVDGGRPKVKTVVDQARSCADELAAICEKGDSLKIENQALAEHHLFRAAALDPGPGQERELTAALEWSPANSEATTWLERIRSR
ncbi:hypothetical protein [Actinomadura sp. NEAU-AAG7]|uniref:hypothetical protein n=1 Tax=Actinomadura sp. NEAU-AAG7 TaxID=2839640 RepID=UPI001BE3E48D|nr:hypothetical protein [Actinomadura sp. NEAU-AAG7]MBT2207927.1 hypothetical protein [Actinomadura sp. NEAU-AAG7]